MPMPMHYRNPHERAPRTHHALPLRWRWYLVAICALTLLVGLLRTRRQDVPVPAPAATDGTSPDRTADSAAVAATPQRPRLTRRMPTPAAEEVVAQKLAQFARSRRDFVYALARRHAVQVSADVERFFDAVESGNWDAIDAAFKKINGGDSSAGHANTRPPGSEHLWPAIIDAYGAAEQVHLWPAQQLLDYGNAVLGALRPGMVYVGGTDNGRWIPELINDTSEGERHIVVTQNGLADGTYLDYLRLQYDDRLATLSPEDSQRAFQEYMADAQKRLEHDQRFPDEPKQVRPGEDIQVSDGKVQVGGQVAVMAINERLLQALMQKNPDLSFAIEESFPLKGTYADALPLGPLMELRAGNDRNGFTAERAAQSLDYWRNTAQQVSSDPAAAGSDSALKSYSHDTAAAANLLAAHSFAAEAEEAYRLASQLWPGNAQAMGGLADLLATTGRENEARQLLDDFARKYPDQQKELERISAATHLLWTAKSPGP